MFIPRLLVLLAVALALTACGSSHSAATTSTSTVAVTTTVPTTTAAPSDPRTIAVDEFEFGFTLSKQTISAGKVTFKMRNTGSIVHNFDLIGHFEGHFLLSGQTETKTITLAPGTYTYVCSVKYHAAQGMQGTLVVT